MTTEARPPIQAQPETKEEQRRRLDQELAESNVLRHAECIGEGGQMLLAEARRVDPQGHRTTPAAVVINNALGLGMSLLTNRRAAAMTFKGRAAAANRITRVLMERVPLPGQIGQAPAPVESEGSKPANAGANAASGVPRAVPEAVGVRPAAPEGSAPSAGPDAPDPGGWELLTDEAPPTISCGSQGADEERQAGVMAMALEAEAEKGSDKMTSAIMRALARSRGPR